MEKKGSGQHAFAWHPEPICHRLYFESFKTEEDVKGGLIIKWDQYPTEYLDIL